MINFKYSQTERLPSSKDVNILPFMFQLFPLPVSSLEYLKAQLRTLFLKNSSLGDLRSTETELVPWSTGVWAKDLVSSEETFFFFFSFPPFLRLELRLSWGWVRSLCLQSSSGFFCHCSWESSLMLVGKGCVWSNISPCWGSRLSLCQQFSSLSPGSREGETVPGHPGLRDFQC